MIAFMNSRLLEMRQQEAWHPEIWYPQLGSDGEPCGKLIHSISIRYAMTPRTIDHEEFKRIRTHYLAQVRRPAPGRSS